MGFYKYEIFTSVIEQQIGKGILRKGDRLPSVREIKNKYGLSGSSVQSGYEYLMIKGLIKSQPRSGYFVSDDQEEMIPVIPTKLLPVSRDIEFSRNISLTSARNKPFESSAFNTAVPGDLLIPQKLILRTMQEVIREKGAALLRYYPSNGSPELRELISKRLVKHGCVTNSEELIITDGALQALFIALRSVTEEGDVIAVESPCVFSVLEVIAGLKLKIIEIPVSYHEGFDVNYFEKVCMENNIRAVVLTPNFHNPTGICMKDHQKKKLLEISETFEIPVIENDIYGDLYFSDQRPACIKKFDVNGWVMTFSSYSKTLAPGIRLGFLDAGRFYARAEKIKFNLGRSVSPIYQELMVKLLQRNSYDRHLYAFRKKLQQQAISVLDALRIYFPKDSYFHKPEGGYSIWGELPKEIDMTTFYDYCEKNRILFTPGSTFSTTEVYHRNFRIVFADHITQESLMLIEKAGIKAKMLLGE